MSAQILGAAVLGPHGLELALQNLGALLHCQTRLVQAQLAHVHVVHACQQQYAWLVFVDFHLTRDPLSVEVRVPPALFGVMSVGRPRERYAKEALLGCVLVVFDRLAGRGGAQMNVLEAGYDGLWGSFGGTSRSGCFGAGSTVRRLLLVLGLPCVVDLEATVELFAARLQQVEIARGVDGITQLGVLPLGQVVFTAGARRFRHA